MYAITGVTGKVGRALARSLLRDAQPVRAILRNEAKAGEWASLGCEIALADLEDSASLAAAFASARGVFILPPSQFDPQTGYPEARKVIDAVVAALAETRPRKVVCLSTIGADAVIDNLLTQRTLLEQALNELDLDITYLRPAWFMENAQWDIERARHEGILRSFLYPADRKIPMIATRDVGDCAARLLRSQWTGKRLVELEAQERVSPHDLAKAFSIALERPVTVEIVERHLWEETFRAEGMQNPLPRMRMLDGFNQGWIEFREGGRFAERGPTSLQQAVAEMVAGASTDDVNGSV